MRSKTLFVSNVLASIYSVYLLINIGGAIIQLGGIEYVKALMYSFKFLFSIVGMESATVNLAYAILIGLCVHIVGFAVGSVFGWFAWLAKKSKLAKFSAALYLIATIGCVFFFIIALPITIFGFVGAKKQKKINNTQIEPQA